MSRFQFSNPQDPIDLRLQYIAPGYMYYPRIHTEIQQVIQTKQFGLTVRKSIRGNDLATLVGTIETIYKGTKYNTPITIMFPYGYPFNAPLCYVEPSEDMEIIPNHQIVYSDKTIRHYMLDNWTQYETIPGLLDALRRDFSVSPPLRRVGGSFHYTVPQPQYHQNPNYSVNGGYFQQCHQPTLSVPQYHSTPNQMPVTQPYSFHRSPTTSPMYQFPQIQSRQKPLPLIPPQSPNQLHIQQSIQQHPNPFNHSYHETYQQKEKPLPPLPINQNEISMERPLPPLPNQNGQRDQVFMQTEMKKSLPSVSSLSDMIDVSSNELDDPEEIRKEGGLPSLHTTENIQQIDGFTPFKPQHSPTSTITGDLKTFVLNYFKPSKDSDLETEAQIIKTTSN